MKQIIVKLLKILSNAALQEEPAPPKVRRALIVEDEEFDCEEIKRHLRDEGWFPLCVKSPREARAMLKVQAFDLIFLDLSFPGDVDGYTFARELRQNEGTQHTPIIYVTGALQLQSAQGECVTHITKSVSMEAVRNALKVANGINGCGPKGKAKHSPQIAVVWVLWTVGVALGHGLGEGWLSKLIKTILAQ